LRNKILFLLLIFLTFSFCFFCGKKNSGQSNEPFIVECTVKLDGKPYKGARVEFQYTENTGSKVPGTDWKSNIVNTDENGKAKFVKTSFSRSVGAAYRVRAEHPIEKYWSDFQSNGMIMPGRTFTHTFLFTSE